MPDETSAGAAPAEQVPATTGTPQTAPSPQPVSGDIEAVIDARLEQFAEGLAKRLKQSQRDVVEDRLTKALNKYFGAEGPAASQPKPESPAPSAPATAPSPAAPVSATSGFEAEIKQILDGHQLTGSEPELREYAEANRGKPWYQVGPKFAELAATLAARRAGSPAGVVAPTGGTAPAPDLAQNFIDAVAAARAAGQYGAAVLRRLKAEYRAKGLTNVDSIRFEISGVPVSSRGKSDGLT
jgi:hypothetical protein